MGIVRTSRSWASSFCQLLGELRRADRKIEPAKPIGRATTTLNRQGGERQNHGGQNHQGKTGVDPPLSRIGTARRASRTCRLGGSVAQSASCVHAKQGTKSEIDTFSADFHNPAASQIGQFCLVVREVRVLPKFSAHPGKGIPR